MSDTEYGLVEPFDIDNGELDGISVGESFCLGVEWQIFRQRMATGKPFTELCLANNAARLAKLAERKGRFSECHQTETEGWASLTVGGRRD